MNSWVEKPDLAGVVAKVAVFIWLKQKGKPGSWREELQNAILKWPKRAGICETAATILKGSREGKEEVFIGFLALSAAAAHLGQGGEAGGVSKANCKLRIVGEFPSTEGEEK